MDYETSKVTIELDAPNFELIFEVFQMFTSMVESEGLENVPTRIQDQYAAVKNLNFRFSDK